MFCCSAACALPYTVYVSKYFGYTYFFFLASLQLGCRFTTRVAVEFCRFISGCHWVAVTLSGCRWVAVPSGCRWVAVYTLRLPVGCRFTLRLPFAPGLPLGLPFSRQVAGRLPFSLSGCHWVATLPGCRLGCTRVSDLGLPFSLSIENSYTPLENVIHFF